MSQITLNALVGYFYGNIGNVLKNAVNGQATIFTFDAANQLVSSTCDGVTTRYAYDAAGRMIKEGNRTYAYGYLDKVMAVTENDRTITYAYHPDGQLASANYGDRSESFAWDGLALIRRGDEQFINEPHVGGGNPVASSKGMTYFNDMLGTTVGAKSGATYTAAALSAFGEDLAGNGKEDSTHSSFSIFHSPFFTGKPAVEGLGYAFLIRNYRASLGKWQTADPMGYPDGWNQLAYCNNGVTSAVDLFGSYSKSSLFELGMDQIRSANDCADKIAGDSIRNGYEVEYRRSSSLLYYCNEKTNTDVETIYLATQVLVFTTTDYYADIYECGYFLITMTKDELAQRVLACSWEGIKAILGPGGSVISVAEAALSESMADVLGVIEGNIVCVETVETYKLLEKHALIDRTFSYKSYPIWE